MSNLAIPISFLRTEKDQIFNKKSFLSIEKQKKNQLSTACAGFQKGFMYLQLVQLNP